MTGSEIAVIWSLPLLSVVTPAGLFECLWYNCLKMAGAPHLRTPELQGRYEQGCLGIGCLICRLHIAQEAKYCLQGCPDFVRSLRQDDPQVCPRP